MKNDFVVPSIEKRKLALGDLTDLPSKTKNALQQVVSKFKPITKPKEDDWLFDRKVKGQTFENYQQKKPNKVTSKRNVIYIKPLEVQISKGFLQELKNYCECFFYPLTISLLESTPMTLEGVKRRINDCTQKQQLNATDILNKLKKSLKSDAFCLIGVAMTDLYPRDSWNYVFGLASIYQRTGVFSFARYDSKFFTQAKHKINYDRILWRSMSVMCHEITHMFGITHCIYYNCLMNGSNTDKQAEKKTKQLCPVCLRKLQSNIKFDILERYQKLYLYLEKKQDQRVENLRHLIGDIITKIKEK